MNSKTRSALKMIAIVIVILMVLMQLNLVVIPMLVPYSFWLMVIAFAMLWISG